MNPCFLIALCRALIAGFARSPAKGEGLRESGAYAAHRETPYEIRPENQPKLPMIRINGAVERRCDITKEFER
jgi:hypothetical protein